MVPELPDDLLARHADAVVDDGHGARRRVVLDPHFQFGVRLQQRRVRDGLEAQAVGRIRGIGDQLPEEDLPVAVEGMNHEVQQLLHLGLKTVGFARGDGHGPGTL